MQRLKAAFNPASHDAALSHYIPAVQYADSGVENSIWQSDLAKIPEDWRGNTGRIYSMQVLTSNGGLLFANKLVTTQGFGGLGIPFGQSKTVPVAGYGGQPSVLDATSTAAEFDAVVRGTA
jgi:hypothetical protein